MRHVALTSFGLANNKSLILGKWVDLKYNQENNYQILNYHWSDLNKFKNDLDYIRNLYLEILDIIYLDLNKIHDKNYSKKFWEIIAGPWLATFLQVSFDRYTSIQELLKTTDKHLCYDHFQFNDPFLLAPKNSYDFYRSISTDIWNQSFFQYLISNHFQSNKLSMKLRSINEIKIDINKKFFSDSLQSNLIVNKKKISYKVKFLIDLILSKFIKRNKIYIFNSGINYIKLLKISISLKQFFKFNDFPIHPINQFSLNRNFRILKKFIYKNDFEKFIKNNLINFIPHSILENFDLHNKLLDKSHLPTNPKLIITGYAYKANDLFKIWIAKKNYFNNSKICIIEHGNFGTYEYVYDRDHQLKISDIYLSWGWKFNNPNVIAFTSPHNKNEYNYNLKNKNILLVTVMKSRYSAGLYSGAHSSQWNDYVDDQLNFLSNINNNIINNMVIREKHEIVTYAWNLKELIENRYPFIKFSKKTTSLLDEYKRSKIIVVTYNGTALLETMMFNIPTIIFYNFKVWRINQEVKKKYQLLKDVGILFDDPKQAADHLNSIYDNPLNWWNSKDVKNAREYFCKNLCNTTNNYVNDFVNIVSKVTNNKNNEKN